ncbi:hypothetical protein [Aestuariispira insulae]|uniref:Uncharacterized protein n=1 Tax=Aestuariispira insulae TaxID=1461337 RepID=A0A3D9HP18_9PROT|nr:hypothetical protein [Aestuariispira insulae]RED51244.1 hypothetical protein DFP90_10342 [Aestuariispira insulae]
MNGFLKLFLIIIVAGVVGGGVFLASWDIPAPSTQVEKVLDDSQFPR